MTNAARPVKRGDVLPLPINFVSGKGSKVRPAVVIQNDRLNSMLQSTVVAIITSTLTEVGGEQDISHLFHRRSWPVAASTDTRSEESIFHNRVPRLLLFSRRKILHGIARWGVGLRSGFDFNAYRMPLTVTLDWPSVSERFGPCPAAGFCRNFGNCPRSKNS